MLNFTYVRLLWQQTTKHNCGIIIGSCHEFDFRIQTSLKSTIQFFVVDGCYGNHSVENITMKMAADKKGLIFQTIEHVYMINITILTKSK